MSDFLDNSGVSAPSDSSAPSSGAVDSPSTMDTTGSVEGTASPEGVTAPSPAKEQEPDPLAEIPAIDELRQQAQRGIQHAAALANLREQYEKIAPQHKEWSTKFEPFSPVIDRLGTAEDAISLVDMWDSLFKQTRDEESGQWRADPSGFAQQISQESPGTATALARELVWGTTTDPRTGQEIRRVDLLMENIAGNPELRSWALQTLGAVEPDQIPQPTWSATEEELNKFISLGLPEPQLKALQEKYQALPYDLREEMLGNSAEFIRDKIEERNFIAETRADKARAQAVEAQRIEQEQIALQNATSQAGISYINSSIEADFEGLVSSIVNDWHPTDDESLNKAEAGITGLTVVALGHGETRFAAKAYLQDLGIAQEDIAKFDTALQNYVSQHKNYGEMSFQNERRAKMNGTNGTQDRSMTTQKAATDRAKQDLRAQAKSLATKIVKARDRYFVGRATTHNNSLESATVRPVPSGAPAPTGGGNPYLGLDPSKIYGR